VFVLKIHEEFGEQLLCAQVSTLALHVQLVGADSVSDTVAVTPAVSGSEQLSSDISEHSS